MPPVWLQASLPDDAACFPGLSTGGSGNRQVLGSCSPGKGYLCLPVLEAQS